MEDNVADALKMAAAVLMFVIALSVGISSFSQARQTVDTIVSYTDREYEYTYVEQNGGTQRIVNIESIIPVIYRSANENYKIYFQDKNGEGIELYKKINESGQSESISFIDLKDESVTYGGSVAKPEDFINAILYGSKISNFSDIKTYFYTNQHIVLNETGLYDTIIKEKSFIELIGEYYQEDEGNDESQTPDTNKTRKRIYTYILNN